jgi:amino acid adenylation domain-containing protein
MVKKHENSQFLVAYYTSKGEIKVAQEKIIEHLKQNLPEYMIPQMFVELESFPLTENGKLDIKALPNPNNVNRSEYVAPRNDLEKKLCEIYARVLNLSNQKVGIQDDFFKMGGDSISSIRLVSQIRQQLKLKVTIQDIFSHRTVEQLEDNVLINQNSKEKNVIEIKQRNRDKNINWEYINKIRKNPKIEDVYFANNLLQSFIYYAIRYGKTDSIYVSQFVWKYDKSIDVDKFKKAWQLVQQKYPSLRLRFAWDEELIQIIDKKQNLDFRYVDLINLGRNIDSECQSRLANIIKRDQEEYYDLQKGNLFRVYLIKFSLNNYSCICSAHHIIIDGWSFTLLFNSVHEIYLQLLRGEQPKIIKDVSYRKAQKYLWEHKNECREYWDNRLKQIEDRVDLKSLLKPSAQNVEVKNHKRVTHGEEQQIEIKGSIFAELKKLCQLNAITINGVIQYAWHKILHIYGVSNTTVVGTVVAGRNIPVDNIESSVGLFVNTLPLIFKHDSKSTIIEQIKVIQNLINEISDKSNIELASLQPGGERLFDSLLAYENYPMPECTMGTICHDMHDSFKLDYPLVLIAYEKEQTLTIILKYAGELFSHETISNLLNKLLFFIEQIVKNPHKKTLSYLNSQEYQNIVIDYNKTEKKYSANKTVHQLFEEQALRTPSNIAVVYENERIAYNELNQRANQLAHWLQTNYETKPDDLIVLCLDRNEQMLVAMLGILKSGGAYVPVDPDYPEERIAYILNDTNAKVVLTNSVHKDRLQQVIKQKKITPPDIKALDSVETQIELSKQKSTNLALITASTDLAYIIYTSGTTGSPKGVMIEHRGVVSLVKNIDYINITADDSFIQFSDPGFDATTFEVWAPLLNGAKLVIPYNKEDLFSNIKLFHEILIKNKITTLFLTKALFDYLFIADESVFEGIKYLLTGGEALDRQLILKLVNSKYRPKDIISCYGPTENTTFSSTLNLTKENLANCRTVPIGMSLANRKAYVLDNNLNTLPIGAMGELYLAGAGLARGYLNQPKLTSETFIPNPFQTLAEKTKNINNKLYKTGDLVRMLPDGNIEYIERRDFQVKIRGYRVELGEIENRLQSYPDIKQSVVVLSNESSDKLLVAYYVANRELDEKKIENYLAKQLPDYMMPSIFIHIQKLPLTASGKLDRKALPRPSFANENRYIPPKNRLEELVCKAFANVLGLKQVGINDDFFRLGGTSIKAIKLISALQTNFDIKIADIFDLRTPRKLVQASPTLGKDFLQHKLEMVKIVYQQEHDLDKSYNPKLQKDLDDYVKSTEKLHINVSLRKSIRSVLLTGSTGYLGCNILSQLLNQTDHQIYLLIRANSQTEAIEKINKKYQFYFNQSLNDAINSRIVVFKSDIEQDFLGLSQLEYQHLITNVDSVIHAAALVKHYGEYDKFYSANVKSTINLLAFA